MHTWSHHSRLQTPIANLGCMLESPGEIQSNPRCGSPNPKPNFIDLNVVQSLEFFFLKKKAPKVMLEGSRVKNHGFNHQCKVHSSQPFLFPSASLLLASLPTSHIPRFTQGPAGGSIALASPACGNMWSCLAQACQSQSLAPLPRSAFRDVMLLAQNWLWQGYLHHSNWQTLQSGLFSSSESQLLSFNSTASFTASSTHSQHPGIYSSSSLLHYQET